MCLLSPWPPNPIQHICPLTPTSYQLPFPRPPTFKYVQEEYLWTDVLLSVCLLPGPGSGLTVVVLNVIPAQTGAKPDTGGWRTETRRVVTSRWRLDDDLSPVHSVLLSCDPTLSAPHSAPPFHLQILNLFRFANFTG